MKYHNTTRICLSVLLLLSNIFSALSLLGQTREKGPWWPHPIWGVGDEAGGSNWITPEKVLSAISLVKKGEVYELGNIYERGMPLVGDRSYNMFIASFPTYGPVGEDKIVFNDEYLATEIGQVGTQFDGPGHVGKVMTMEDGTTTEVFYNGAITEEMKSPYGLLKNGVENVKPIITTGILIDIAAYKGVDILPEGYEVTLDDIKKALMKEGLTEQDISPGDALLFNLGWWRHWPQPYALEASPPYINREVVNWIIEKNPPWLDPMPPWMVLPIGYTWTWY